MAAGTAAGSCGAAWRRRRAAAQRSSSPCACAGWRVRASCLCPPHRLPPLCACLKLRFAHLLLLGRRGVLTATVASHVAAINTHTHPAGLLLRLQAAEAPCFPCSGCCSSSRVAAANTTLTLPACSSACKLQRRPASRRHCSPAASCGGRRWRASRSVSAFVSYCRADASAPVAAVIMPAPLPAVGRGEGRAAA